MTLHGERIRNLDPFPNGLAEMLFFDLPKEDCLKSPNNSVVPKEELLV